MDKLHLRPLSAGYAARQESGVIQQKLDGGLSRKRLDVLNGTFEVSVTWRLNPENFTYLNTFYRVTSNGSKPFLMDLILEQGEVTEYTCSFVPDSFRLARTEGYMYEVTAELEVVPNVADAVYDATVVALVSSFGEDASQVLNLLEILANTKLPDITD